MLHYWLSVAIKSFSDALDFVGQSKSGISFALLVLILTAIWLWRQHGWRDAMKHWWRTAGEGVVIALVAWVLVWVLHFLWEPYHLQQDEIARKTEAVSAKDAVQNLKLSCDSDLRNALTRADILERQVSTQQTQISSQQTLSATQQSTFNLCVTTLTKANTVSPLKVWPYMQLLDNMKQESNHVSQIVILTNKTISPVRISIACEGNIKSGYGGLPGQNTHFDESYQVVEPHVLLISAPHTTWTPEIPYIVTLIHTTDLGRCQIMPQ